MVKAHATSFCLALLRMNFDIVTFQIPLEFPLTSETVLSVPKFGLGRNALGVIYMQLREMVSFFLAFLLSSDICDWYSRWIIS